MSCRVWVCKELSLDACDLQNIIVRNSSILLLEITLLSVDILLHRPPATGSNRAGALM